MKKIGRIAMLLAALIFIATGISWGFYVKKQPIYLPYVDMSGVHWSTFYTRYYMEDVPLSIEEFEESNPWFLSSFEGLSTADEYSVKRQSYDYFRAMSGGRVSLDLMAEGGRAIVASGDLNGRFQCMVLRYRLDNHGYEFVDSSALVVHGVAGVITNLCNQEGEFSVQKAEFSDFIFYDVLRCFSFCGTKDGIVFKERMFGSKKKRFVKALRTKLSSEEMKYQSLDRKIDEVEVEIESIIASENECFVRFSYVNPIYGEVSRFARFDCDSDELVSVNDTGGVAHYFFVL